MKIAIIGSGGREHAICEKLNTSKKKLDIFCIPGNAGTSLLAKNINLDYTFVGSGMAKILKKNDDNLNESIKIISREFSFKNIIRKIVRS